jgi:hypothetical protein
MTFDTRGHTMMGVSPEKAVAALAEWGADAIGGNCGNGPEEVVRVIERMRAAAPNVTLVAKSNVGMPQLVEVLFARDGMGHRPEVALEDVLDQLAMMQDGRPPVAEPQTAGDLHVALALGRREAGAVAAKRRKEASEPAVAPRQDAEVPQGRAP